MNDEAPRAAEQADALVLDERGRRCPLPVIELARRIVDVPVGGVVRLLSDDPAAANDIPAWCAMRSQELVEVITEGLGVRAYRVRRSS